MRRYPHLYEINTCLFIKRMSRKYGRALSLTTVPEEEWQIIARRGFDLVWLMGVWQRSPGARQEALHHVALRREYDRVLPGWTNEDVEGSPYAIYSYELNSLLGKTEELAELRLKLNRLGLGLILDFIPNHLALDHPWVYSHPQRFIQGSAADSRTHPDEFFLSETGAYLAHGRDPNFPPWTDTVQVNFYSADLRQALIGELTRIAEFADGVRCDMAMLALNDVFQRVWGKHTGYPRPDKEFWSEAITTVKERQPDFLFIAEVYWEMERQLQQLGFDFFYDKKFYDSLRYSNASVIQNYLNKKIAFQQCCVRFIENHDEERAITAFGRERSLAAAVVLSTVPGLRFFHDGQLEGHRLRLPVQLVREPEESTDYDITRFYERLLEVCNSPLFHDGEWGLLQASQVREFDITYHHLLTWYWRYEEQLKIVAVNYSSEHARGYLKLPLPIDSQKRVILHDEMSGETFIPDVGHPEHPGLHLDMKPWNTLILNVTSGSHR